jgi:hypothetical protein
MLHQARCPFRPGAPRSPGAAEASRHGWSSPRLLASNGGSASNWHGTPDVAIACCKTLLTTISP